MLDIDERYHRTETILFVRESEDKRNQSMPITISEDDSDEEEPLNGMRLHSKTPRCLSLPTNLYKSIMITKTLDDSLHRKYGSDRAVRRSKKHLSLQFDKINLREYMRTVGDNPSCSSGPPVSNSWDYIIIGDINLDEYEKMRPPRRVQNEMVLTRSAREHLLRYEWDASRKEIIEAVRQNVRVKNQRRTTVNNLGKATKFEEAMESVTRKFKRLVKGQKSVNKQVRDLEHQIEVTKRRRSKLIYLDQKISGGGQETAPTVKVSVALSDSGKGSENFAND
mmetsp:Transcript_25757/g.60387  ORF Transcript_25757/g.60387 Transcript_25757/m.60387 type:complete len:280 (-) Transcript_25757:271-1110(-)